MTEDAARLRQTQDWTPIGGQHCAPFDIAAHLARLGPLLVFDRFDLEASHIAGDTAVLEFTCKGRGVDTGIAYDQTYISVVTLRGGRIARYKDYWNPLVVLAALGGIEAAAALTGGDVANV